MEDPEEYYDVEEDYDGDSHGDNSERMVYPPRLMVDFTSLGMNSLLRYAQFYQITVREGTDKKYLAAQVARHFDGTLEVEEDESIVSFMQRIRNGEKSVVRHRPPEKDRKNKNKETRKKSNSNSRKRPRDSSIAGGKDAIANGASDSKSGSKGGDVDNDPPPPPSRPKHSSGPSSSASSGPSSGGNSSMNDKSNKTNNSHKKNDSKKKTNDNGEDNELYCICNLPSYGNMIACDGKNCPNPSQWYHLECVGFSDGRHPDTWLCPECDPKGFADFKKKKKSKQRSKSPGSK